ncbi:MAG: prephenate dehydrogenase [Phycisphaerae bacterium]|nr:prephenate dehydrogenase [Phycisphaerae bacterium]
MEILETKQIGIVGTGLLGGSVGLALKAAGYRGRVVGYARTQSTLEQAQDRGCIDAGFGELAAVAADSDLLVLAAPVRAIPALIESLAPHVPEAAVITDVGSTKQAIVEAAGRHLLRPGRFVGAHPMAGKTQQGPAAADGSLFSGKPCIITAGAACDEGALELVRSLWRTLGMKLLEMSAAEHDRQTAVVSHLPHALAVVMMLAAAEVGGREVASTGLDSVTRLAASNPPMRADIIEDNRRYLLDALDGFDRHLAGFRAVLESGDGSALLEMLEKARAARDDWFGENHG